MKNTHHQQTAQLRRGQWWSLPHFQKRKRWWWGNESEKKHGINWKEQKGVRYGTSSHGRNNSENYAPKKIGLDRVGTESKAENGGVGERKEGVEVMDTGWGRGWGCFPLRKLWENISYLCSVSSNDCYWKWTHLPGYTHLPPKEVLDISLTTAHGPFPLSKGDIMSGLQTTSPGQREKQEDYWSYKQILINAVSMFSLCLGCPL